MEENYITVTLCIGADFSFFLPRAKDELPPHSSFSSAFRSRPHKYSSEAPAYKRFGAYYKSKSAALLPAVFVDFLNTADCKS